MNNLKEYIIEKLHINKNTKVFSGELDYELVKNILCLSGWNIPEVGYKDSIKNRENNPLVSGIEKWIINHKIIDVTPYASYKNLKDWGEDDDIINKFNDDESLIKKYITSFVDDRDFLVKVDGDDKSTQYEIYYDDDALLYRESDNGDFWATRLFLKN